VSPAPVFLALQAVRNEQYHNYFNLEEAVLAAAPAIAATAVKARPGARLFDFYRSWRGARSSIVHFQLRNLLWATSGGELGWMRGCWSLGGRGTHGCTRVVPPTISLGL
jgi:hypothetical protein